MLQVGQVDQVQTLEQDEIMEAAFPKFKALAPLTQENGWVLSSDKNGYQIHTKPDPTTGLCLTRGEGFIPYTIEEIFAVLETVEGRPQYDEMCESGHVITRYDQHFMLFYQRFKGMMLGLIQGRDFIVLSKTFMEGPVWHIVGTSVELPAHPPIKGVVRGTLKLGGWVLERKENGTQCIFITWADPKGNLPTAAVNIVASGQGQIVEKVKKLLDKKLKKK